MGDRLKLQLMDKRERVAAILAGEAWSGLMPAARRPWLEKADAVIAEIAASPSSPTGPTGATGAMVEAACDSYLTSTGRVTEGAMERAVNAALTAARGSEG